jgi:thioesterase domain-containing protein/acyl carrier protein
MVPSGIAVLERLPRTPNGKLDRAALPQSGLGASTLLDDPAATATEIRLAAFVAQLLHRETVGRHNDLFGLGLHSLMAVRLVAYVRETFSIAVTIRDVFDNPTIAALSRVVDEIATGVLPQTPSPGPLPIVVHNEGGEQPPLVFFHTDAETHGMYCQRLATGIGISQPVFAAAPHGTATLPILSTIEAMARDYVPRIKALQPTGPYRLGGYCDGALVAFELARILRAQGESVERVVICNAYAPTRLRFPLLDALARWFGLDESRDSHLREKFCRNIALFYSNLNAGPPALVRFLVERLITAPRHRARVRQNFIDHPEIYVRPRGTAETRRHFSQLVATVTYHPGVYDGDVTLIWSSGEYPLMGDPTRGDPTKGWASIVTGDVRVITMDSDHIAPLRERSEELGRLVADAIRSPAGSTKAWLSRWPSPSSRADP